MLHLFHMTCWRRSLWGQSVGLDMAGAHSAAQQDGTGRRPFKPTGIQMFVGVGIWSSSGGGWRKTKSPLPSPSCSPSLPSRCPASPVSTHVYPLNPSPPSLRCPPSRLLSGHHFSNRLLGALNSTCSLSFHLHPSPASISAGPRALSPLPPPCAPPLHHCPPPPSFLIHKHLYYLPSTFSHLSRLRLIAPFP